MRAAKFKELMLLIRKKWTANRGLIVNLALSDCQAQPTLRLCAGPKRNEYFSANKCVVWKDGAKAYDGQIGTKELQKLLTANKVCCAEITTVARLESNRLGEFICLKTYNGNCTKDCVCRRKESNAKPTTVQSAATGV